MTLSPTLTSSAVSRPSSRRLPLPTATTSPCIGFSCAVSGMMMPALVLVSAVIGLINKRSCKGLNFMVFPLSGIGAAYRERRLQVSTRAVLPALELGRCRGVERDAEPRDLAIVPAAAHVAVTVQPGDGRPVTQRHGDLARRRLAAQLVFARTQEFLDPFPAQRRNRILAHPLRADRGAGLQDGALLDRQGIDLVQCLD